MKNFITSHIDNDIKNGTYPELAFRFPPEPNGFLHLGHAKSIVLNSWLAKNYNAKLYLRLDDTNPETERDYYAKAIEKDAKWLTLKDFEPVTHTSDYFDMLYDAAELLINKGLAYVDFSTDEELKASRGGFGNADEPTKYRNNSIEKNLKYFRKMKSGAYKDGEAVLRAKIDLNSPNMNMRDPVMYRIKHMSHYRTADKWCIYPMYSFAHPLGDCIEKISHSLCTLEFEDFRVLYDWYVNNCFEMFNWKPVELEFSRLELEGVELSKRKLLSVVESKGISWDNPVMPTISGMRNRGITAEVLVDFILKCGFSKINSVVPMELFEDSVRDVNKNAKRIMAVINPVKLNVINNDIYKDESIVIDASDVRESPENDFWRVYPGNWTRLKHKWNFYTLDVHLSDKKNDSYINVEVDEDSVDMKKAKVKAKVAIHWLNNGVTIPMKKYNPLIINEVFNPNNSETLDVLIDENMERNTIYEFERVGYFFIDANGVANLLAPLRASRK